jgi:predicted metal-dependent phosphoesterase TrpH
LNSGAEVTTSEVHLLVLGVQELPPRGLSPEETAEMARVQGGITIVPHPYHPFRHAIGRIPDCDAVEVLKILTQEFKALLFDTKSKPSIDPLPSDEANNLSEDIGHTEIK